MAKLVKFNENDNPSRDSIAKILIRVIGKWLSIVEYYVLKKRLYSSNPEELYNLSQQIIFIRENFPLVFNSNFIAAQYFSDLGHTDLQIADHLQLLKEKFKMGELTAKFLAEDNQRFWSQFNIEQYPGLDYKEIMLTITEAQTPKDYVEDEIIPLPPEDEDSK